MARGHAVRGSIIPYSGVMRGTGPTRAGWQTPPMHARSALFDVYGDHLRGRGSQAPVAGLVRLLDPVGIAAPAVRTAISRMVMQDWLEPVRLGGGRGYRATSRAIRRLDEAADRIYRRTDPAWDGTWHLAFVDPPADPRRAQPAAGRPRLHGVRRAGRRRVGQPLPARRAGLGARARGRRPPAPRGPTRSTRPRRRRGTSTRCARRTSTGSATADDLIAAHAAGHDDPDEAAFAARFHLVHEWRKFLFADPGLPDELLPARLAGPRRGRPVRRRGDPAQAGGRPVRGPVPRRAASLQSGMTDVRP